jgi:hypothetical protein
LLAEWPALSLEKLPRSDVRLVPQQSELSGRSLRDPKRSPKQPADDARLEGPLPNRAKPGRHLAAKRKKRKYHVDRWQQNHAKQRELGDDRHHREPLGNEAAVAENGIKRSIKKDRLGAQSFVFNLLALSRPFGKQTLYRLADRLNR